MFFVVCIIKEYVYEQHVNLAIVDATRCICVSTMLNTYENSSSLISVHHCNFQRSLLESMSRKYKDAVKTAKIAHQMEKHYAPENFFAIPSIPIK